MALNIYQKLAEARKQLRNSKMKKTGKNKFAGYEYFELGDFLNPMVDIFDEIGIVSLISFGVEIATLTVFDAENPKENIVITSPMSTAALKACHEVQNLGAVQTYLRRYLYIALMEILEHDACGSIDCANTTKKETKKQSPTNKDQNPISTAELKHLCAAITSNKRDMDKFGAWLLEMYQIDSKKKIPKMLFGEILAVVEGK